eukprot:g5911.t1
MPLKEHGVEAPTFLEKLWDMLDDESNYHAIEWEASGSMFEVKSPKQMGSHVLSKYFRHNNFASFQRQLNYFGFHKCGKGSYGCFYKHEHFLRGEPKRLLQIQRKTNHNSSSGSGGGGGGARRGGGAGDGGEGGSARPTLAVARSGAAPRRHSAQRPAMSLAGDSPLGMLGHAAAANLVKRQSTGLYINDPGLVPVTPLTPADRVGVVYPAGAAAGAGVGGGGAHRDRHEASWSAAAGALHGASPKGGLHSSKPAAAAAEYCASASALASRGAGPGLGPGLGLGPGPGSDADVFQVPQPGKTVMRAFDKDAGAGVGVYVVRYDDGEEETVALPDPTIRLMTAPKH